MKLFSKISFSLLTLLCTHSLMANNCLPQNECCDAPFSCLEGVTFRAEGLYLWAGESDLDYASYNHYAQSQVGNISAVAFENKYKSPNFSNRLGYRVGLDYVNPCSCLGFNVTYFRFKTTAHGKVTAPANASASGSGGSEAIYVTPLFGYSGNSNNGYNKCGSNLKLQVNLLDFDFGKTFCYSSCFNFRPFIGVRYADISENFRIRASGTDSSTPRLQDIVLTQNTYLKNGFTGFGIHAGLDCDWQLNCGFSLYGKAAGSILYGRTHRSARNDSLRNDFTNNAISGFAQYLKASQRGPRSIFELELGVKTDYCICKNHVINLKLGWTQFLFLNNNRFDNSVLVEKGGGSFSFSRNGDLGLQGIVFGADYAF